MRRGAALAVTIFFVAIGAALVVTGSFLVRQQVAVGSLDNQARDLEPLAERALVETLASWDTIARRGDLPGARVEMPGLVEAPVRVSVTSTRLGPVTWWIAAEAVGQRKPLLRRSLGVLVDVSSGRPLPAAPMGWFDLP